MSTRGTFRNQDFGDVEFEVNTKSMTSDRFVDRSRIGTHDEWVSSENPMKPGRVVQVQDSVEDSARRGCDAMKHRSVFRDESAPRNDGMGVPCFYDDGRGPLTRRRGDR